MGEGERKVSFDKRREHVDGKLPGTEAGELEGFKPWQTNAQSHTVCQYCILDGSLSKYPYPQSLTRAETVHTKLLRSRHPPKLYYYSLQFWWRRLLKKIVCGIFLVPRARIQLQTIFFIKYHTPIFLRKFCLWKTRAQTRPVQTITIKTSDIFSHLITSDLIYHLVNIHHPAPVLSWLLPSSIRNHFDF